MKQTWTEGSDRNSFSIKKPSTNNSKHKNEANLSELLSEENNKKKR